MQDIQDIVIVGYGPAGITAGLYAARKRLRVVLVGAFPGGEVSNSGEIENWPGDGMTDGITLADKFIKHLNDHKDSVSIVNDTVTTVKKEHGMFTVATKSRAPIQSKTVIYAAGRHPRELGIPGEREFRNRGVSYCAVCDAPLFPQKDVAVVGGGNTGAEAVIMFQKIAKKTYLLHNTDVLRADPVLVNNFMNDQNVNVIYSTQTTRIEGANTVQELVYKDLKTGAEKSLAVDAVFVAIGAIPNTEPVRNFVVLDEFGAIISDQYGKTSVDGFFAAGDVTNIRDAQIVVAAGHGCSAALSAADYISRTA